MARIHIIGGSDLSKVNLSREGFEGSNLYEEICRSKSKSIMNFDPKTSIVFHGSLASERFELMRNCSLVIVNPTGISEAISTTVIECFMNRIPVVSGKKYVNRELLDGLPHAEYRNSFGILNKGLLDAYQARKEELLSLNYLKGLRFSEGSFSFNSWAEIVRDVLFDTTFRRFHKKSVIENLLIREVAKKIEKRKTKVENFLSKRTHF
ncbi:hypothetical protein [Cyanobium sp. HWJ4-Hawea]|uniref:hypothetical protein n=1 Tax=Cyanobium sp. HWJ4-Hawea TaxID=2823713 RepID=UPI0020CDA500|nr:hypothetical protein [Cyanobium sp. HWJ4-Hawea]